MGWMCITLSSADLDAGRDKQIFDAFDAAFTKAGAPETTAMFERQPTPDECVYYFSPGAADIFSESLAPFGAKECEAPPRAGSSLSIGSGDPFTMLR